jgi:hypothetical protein
METIIGFAAGYLTGTREGKEGIERLRNSLQAIARSPEARRIATNAVTVTSSLVGRGSARSAARTAGALARIVIKQITEPASDRNVARS